MPDIDQRQHSYTTPPTTGVVDNPDVQAALDALSIGFARLVLRAFGPGGGPPGREDGAARRHHTNGQPLKPGVDIQPTDPYDGGPSVYL
jgi:hypothetical protein